jgi:hypothetical protein
MDGSGFEFRLEQVIFFLFTKTSKLLWGIPSLLFNEYRILSEGKAAGS